MAPIIKTENLRHLYSEGTPFEHVAIDDINFSAEKGEIIGIIGHTGSGKSTFIQHLNGLLKPSSGRVLFNGEDIFSSKTFTHEVRFKVGLVFQYPEYQLFEETVYKDIAFGPKNMKLSEEQIDISVRGAAEFVGVDEELLNKSPFDLSGGQKRRVAIAGVMAMQPDVLILDEPTAGLDPSGRDSIITNILRYHDATGCTIILVTHSMEEIARSVDRLVVFNKGHIMMDGAPSEVFEHDEELRSVGLSVPEVSLVAKRLRQLGLPIDRSVYTVEQAKKALLAVRGGAAGAP
ncbi:MAG: energy-coupling factor transporter ATPase [Oscillospiraceae bacterium]|jgi:energy-coupling factor transport system ATP-binding protein|nr:energy-coupling factor transporter ATPase [Oscillospiraceae bacterium]